MSLSPAKEAGEQKTNFQKSKISKNDYCYNNNNNNSRPLGRPIFNITINTTN